MYACISMQLKIIMIIYTSGYESVLINYPVIFIFLYRTMSLLNLTFGDLYSHFCVKIVISP